MEWYDVTDENPVFSSFGNMDRSKKADFYKQIDNAAPLGALGEKPFTLAGVYIEKTTRPDKQNPGQEVDKKLIYLFTDRGVYFTLAVGAYNSLARLWRFLGDDAEGTTLKAVRVKTSSGGTTTVFKMV